MEIFTKAFNRERSECYQKDGSEINELTGPEENEPPEYVRHYSSARKYYVSGDLNRSLCSINRSIDLSAVENWRQYAVKANILGKLQMYQEAIIAFEKAIDINPSDTNVYGLYHQIGFCYASLGNNEKAVEFYSYALELKKQHPNTLYNEDMEGTDDGLILGKRLFQMYENRANSYTRLGKFNEAEKDCLSALKIKPDYLSPCLLLYHIYSSEGQGKKALEFLKKAADLGSNNAQKELHDLCIGYHVAVNNFSDEERAELEECMRVTFEQDNLSEGKRLSLNLINKGINDVIPCACLAVIYATEENWKLCENISKSGLKRDDKNTMLLNLMGVAICNQGSHRISEGLTYLRKGALAGDERCSQNYKFWKSTEHFLIRGPGRRK